MAFGSAIVAVEVKTRVDEDPLIQLTAEKERRMWEAAARLRPRPTRIDIVTVRLDRTGIMIRWIPGVI